VKVRARENEKMKGENEGDGMTRRWAKLRGTMARLQGEEGIMSVGQHDG
jgi:hypothetical protein